MAFEEMSGPRTSTSPKQVFASFDEKSSPAGITSHRPSASLLKDTPPSIIVALSQLAPIVSGLNKVLALVTWTDKDNWSSFLLLSTFWLVCLYGDVAFHYAGNWLLLLFLGIGYFRKKTKTRTIVHAIEEGDDPITTGVEDTQKVLDGTLYEIDCLRARCHLLSSTFQPLYELFTWEIPERSALIGMRLAFVTPIYLAFAWFFTTRALMLLVGTFILICTSPWFKVTCTVCWRLRVVRRVASALLGVKYLPGESNIMQAFSMRSVSTAFDEAKQDGMRTPQGNSRFTTTISVIENQRRWLGLGWTPSLLPHERAPFTDVDDRPGVAPENTALPAAKQVVVDGTTRTVTWKWVDSEWRIEKDRGRDIDGWLYFDNVWRHPAATEEFGKYTRRRKWIRNAECTEAVAEDAKKTRKASSIIADNTLPGKDRKKDGKGDKEGEGGPGRRKEEKLKTLDPEKVKLSISTATTTTNSLPMNKETSATQDVPANPNPSREWREVNGGKELVTVESVKKRPFALRRMGSRASTKGLGVD